MPRPTRLRQVASVPAVMLFKPAGVPMGELEVAILAVEEVEAIRLKDIEDLHQEVCAQRMGVSRATFHQVLKSARGKLADAILNGKAIRVEGGAFAFPGGRFRCRRDGSEWTLPPGPLPGVSSVACPTCNGREVQPVQTPLGACRGGGRGRWRHGWEGSWGPQVPAQRWVGHRHVRGPCGGTGMEGIGRAGDKRGGEMDPAAGEERLE
jgi:predicted DNA-binding protein (UPF0251 family)